jgi:hypothetical protein
MSFDRPRALRALFLVPVLVLAACAATGKPVERSANATTALAERYAEAGTALDSVAAGFSALRDTVETQGIINREKVAVGDVAAAFKGLQKEIDVLGAATKRVQSGRESLRRAMDGYLAAWDKELAGFQSEDLKRASEKRRDSTRASFESLVAELTTVDQGVEGYLGRLAEIEKALGHDLTPAGVSALDGVLSDAAKEAAPLRKTVDGAAELVRGFAAKLSAGGGGALIR